MAGKVKRNSLSKGAVGFVFGALIAIVLIGSSSIEKAFYPFPYRDVIENEARAFGVDPFFVAAVIREESKFVADSESHKGAKGLMQLMPSTARSVAESLNDFTFTDESLLDPERNIQYGTWYLADLQRVFGGNKILVAAAYNGGMGHVQEWINSGRIDPRDIRLEDIPFDETRIYVKRVLKSYDKYRKFYN